MNFLEYIKETFLTEAAALTKGSQRVMNDKKLVAGVADAMRDDARTSPGNFPTNSAKTFQKLPDEELAQWFLENLDKIEARGYEGTLYNPAKDGKYSEWIARRYIAGSHNWEDIIGVMNMNMRDWSLLKNRGLLDPAHSDIPKFNSVRQIGAYVNSHYEHHLKDIRDAAKTAALKKTAKTAKLVDNDDYSIYTVLNRNAARMLGLGTQWCTANSENSSNYENYSKNAMLFQLFPKNVGKDEKGRSEKFQFDASGINSYCPSTGFSFKDVLDHNVLPPTTIAERFPYLYTDLASALKSNKGKLEATMKELAGDEALSQSKDTKTKIYNIDDELKKLENMKSKGYFTDKVRPAQKPEDDETPGEGQVPPGEGQVQQPGNNAQMESIQQLAEAMLEGAFDDMVDQLSNVPNNTKGRWPDQAQRRQAYKDKPPVTGTVTRAPGVVSHKGGEKYSGDLRTHLNPAFTSYEQGPLEPNDFPETDPSFGSSKAIKMSRAGVHPDDIEENGMYAAGTAPTMPESYNKGNDIMENVDKDVAAMMASLKKYDKLTESVAPVLGMKTLNQKVVEEESGDKNPWEKLAKDDKEEGEKVGDTTKTHKGGTVTKTEKGIVHKKADESVEVNEEADPEVLEWMQRFSKLGNMKGYGN